MDDEFDYIDEYLLVDDVVDSIVYTFCKNDIKKNTTKFQHVSALRKNNPNKYSFYQRISHYQFSR